MRSGISYGLYSAALLWNDAAAVNLYLKSALSQPNLSLVAKKLSIFPDKSDDAFRHFTNSLLTLPSRRQLKRLLARKLQAPKRPTVWCLRRSARNRSMTLLSRGLTVQE
jgi:hypothetical protein